MALPPLIPVEDFFENPEKIGGAISPDGTKVSYLAPESNRLNVWVRTIGQDDDVCVTHDHERGILTYRWARDSKRIVYLQDQGGNENFRVFAADLERPDEPARDLTPFDTTRATLLDLPPNDPDHALVALNKRDAQLFDVHRLNLTTGELETVAENPGNIIDWTHDHESRIRGATVQTPSGDYEVLFRDREGDEFRTIAHYDNEDFNYLVGFTADGVLLACTAKSNDLMRLVAIDPATGAEKVVDEDAEADLSNVVLSRMTGKLLAAMYTRDRLVVHPLEDNFARKWENIRAVHPGDLTSLSWDGRETKAVVSYTDDRDPGVTFFVDVEAGQSEFLFRARPKLDPEHLAPMEPIRLTSRDGLTLRGYLTLPVGVEGRNLPTVLFVHGGPWARDQWGYMPDVQFLANRGYAVLQVNYRGSTGFGKSFTHAAEQEFAGKMHDDLVDAVEWVVKEGYADPDRVAIYGGSYGGYATLVGVTFTPDLFAAAVSYVGPSSLVTLIRSFPAYWKPFLQGSWFRYCGDPGTEEQPNAEVENELLERSPISRVDQIRTPLMVVQGANDPRVTKLESDNIVAALQQRGVDVDYLVKDDEGHGFINPENRLDLYRGMERFFAKHLGGRTS
jgi:dipeptidyl aminopeptidase/acylaminoacyl peptidase